MKCYIIKDLLPNYISGLACEEVNIEIKEHLAVCPGCRTVYEQMLAPVSQELSEDKNNHFLKKMKVGIRERYVTVVVLVCVILIALTTIVYNYKIPVPFDSQVMMAEIYKAAPVTKNGLTQWIDLDALNFEQTKKVLEGDSRVIDRIRLILTEEIVCDGIQTNTRTIDRNGESVQVTYYCYTKGLWNLLFGDSRRTRKIIAEDVLYGDSNNSLNYVRKKREIYYLPKGNIDQLNRLSDQEFDTQREHSTHVWSGIL